VKRMLIIISKNNRSNNTANVLPSLLPRICAYFSLQTMQFLLVRTQKSFLPQGAGYPRYATASITSVSFLFLFSFLLKINLKRFLVVQNF